MLPEEYDHFIEDPSDFIVRRFWPRIFGGLKIFGALPPLRSITNYGYVLALAPFGTPEGVKALETLKKAGEEALKLGATFAAYTQKLHDAGFPTQFGGAVVAPFDMLSSFFRGTKGFMLDLYRRPDKVKRLCEVLSPFILEDAVMSAAQTGNNHIFVPLHKGAEGVSSPEQFRNFYWPILRDLLIGCIDNGLVPFLFTGGDCTSRLDSFRDVPEGKMCYVFEQGDMAKIKEALHGRACIRGGLPFYLMATGTPEQVREHCKGLLALAAKDGGYIMDTGYNGMSKARPENVKAMFEATREYGGY